MSTNIYPHGDPLGHEYRLGDIVYRDHGHYVSAFVNEALDPQSEDWVNYRLGDLDGHHWHVDVMFRADHTPLAFMCSCGCDSWAVREPCPHINALTTLLERVGRGGHD
jgi:hypothetical protein